MPTLNQISYLRDTLKECKFMTEFDSTNLFEVLQGMSENQRAFIWSNLYKAKKEPIIETLITLGLKHKDKLIFEQKYARTNI